MKQFAHEDREPDLDLVKPGGVLGGEVEDDAVRRIAQELLTRLLGGEHAAFALDAQPTLYAAGALHRADPRFGEVDVEIVADDVPPRVGGGAVEQSAEKSREVLLGTGIADHAFDLTGGDVEGCD